MASGEFILRRFNGDEVFRLGAATILASRTEDGIRIDLDAETDGVAIKAVSDTAEHPANPRAEVAIIVEALDAAQLVGQRFVVPRGRTDDDDLASLYYYEHDDLNDNAIEFVERTGELFRVRWAGRARDVNFDDGSKPETTIEIDGWFRFEEFKRWSGTTST